MRPGFSLSCLVGRSSASGLRGWSVQWARAESNYRARPSSPADRPSYSSPSPPVVFEDSRPETQKDTTMLNTTKLMRTWAKHADDLNITRPSNRAEHEALLGLIDTITDSVEDLERNPYSALLDLAMQYASDWEDLNEPLPASISPRDALEFWMDQRGVSQKELERAGVADQPTLSKILAGDRGISKRVARRLGDYFQVSPLEFL